jgi:DNA-binding response OmpR family regulator
VPDILVASDAEGVYREVRSVLAAPGTTVRWVRSGQSVRLELDRQPADLAVLDMQIGTMGGIAVAFDLRLEADAGRLSRCPILMLLDRRPDVFMARRAAVEGWVLKPLDPIRLRRAVAALLDGGVWHDPTLLPDPVAVPAASATVGGAGK